MTRRPVRPAKNDEAHWRIGREIPIAILLSIGMQTGVFIWWNATINARVSALEQKADIAAPQGERLTRVEVKVDNLIAAVGELKDILRKDVPAKRN